jgi:hypothetical protein
MVGGTASVAGATTLSGTFDISIYQGNGSGGINDPQEQANQSNPLIAPGNLLGSGSYTGNLSFSENSTNTIGAFLATGGGTLSSGLMTSAVQDALLSSATFNLTSVFVITGTTTSILAGTIRHDDGMSLYDGAGYSNTVADAALPTVAENTAYSGLFGDFQLIYVEANGLPAVLNFDVTRSEAPPPGETPLPAALPLFGTALGALGLFASSKKRKKSVAA